MKDVVYFTTISDVRQRMKELYKDQEKWRQSSFQEVFQNTILPHDPDFFNDFNASADFSDMDDEEFINSINALPLFPNCFEYSDYDLRPFPQNSEIFAHAIANYDYEREHTHGYFEIDFVLKGECELIFENEHRVLPEGSLSIISPGSKHSILICNDECCAVRICLNTNVFVKTFFDILPTDSLLSAFFSSVFYENSQPNYLIFNMGRDKHIRNIVKAIFYEIYQSDNYSVKGGFSGINLLFCHLLRHYNNVSHYCSSTQHSSLYFLKILHYIQTNYNTVTLEVLSEQFHYSTAYLSRFIKERTGRNFSQIIQSLKLEKSKDYLTLSNLPVEEITERIGYESQSYFSRIFKRAYGVPPQKYRKASR